MTAELLGAALVVPGRVTDLQLSSDSVVGDMATTFVRLLDPQTPAPDVDELFRADHALSSVVLDCPDGPELISRTAFEFRMAGRLGFGRARWRWRWRCPTTA